MGYLDKRSLPHSQYNNLSARKIGPVEVVAKINHNAHKLKLSGHLKTFHVFNVKHLVPYEGDNSSSDEIDADSRANLFLVEENDDDEIAFEYVEKRDRKIKPKKKA